MLPGFVVLIVKRRLPRPRKCEAFSRGIFENYTNVSVLLGVHMEELLVLQGQPMNIGLYKVAQEPKDKRLLYYAQRLQKVA